MTTKDLTSQQRNLEALQKTRERNNTMTNSMDDLDAHEEMQTIIHTLESAEDLIGMICIASEAEEIPQEPILNSIFGIGQLLTAIRENITTINDNAKIQLQFY